MLKKMRKAWIGMTVALKTKATDFVTKENGDVNIVTIVVLIGIAVLLAIVFRKAIENLLKNLFDTINSSATNAVTQ